MKIINQTSNDFYNNLKTKNQITFEKYTNKLHNNITNKLENLKSAQIPKLVTDKNNWFINMSNKQIPDNVADILSLGEKFAFNYNKKIFPIAKIITNLEYSIHNIPYDNRNYIRNELTYWVQNWLYNENININKNVFLQKGIYNTKFFF